MKSSHRTSRVPKRLQHSGHIYCLTTALNMATVQTTLTVQTNDRANSVYLRGKSGQLLSLQKIGLVV